MKAGLVVVSLAALVVPAFADRSPVVILGAAFGVRGPLDAPVTGPALLGDARLTLAYEDAPIPVPAPGEHDASARLVPELLVGSIVDASRAEGYFGAGVRGELQFANHIASPTSFAIRMGLYLAARAMVVGGSFDPAGEGAFGQYFFVGRGATRIGWEFSVGGRRVGGVPADRERELDARAFGYVGWAL